MSEQLAVSIQDKYSVLLELSASDAEVLHAASFELKKRGLVNRLGIRPVVKLILANGIQRLKTTKS